MKEFAPPGKFSAGANVNDTIAIILLGLSVSYPVFQRQLAQLSLKHCSTEVDGLMLSLVAQNGGCCAMLMPKNGAATAAPCGKNNMAVYPYNGHAADPFQHMAMPLNGQYPVASKFLF